MGVLRRRRGPRPWAVDEWWRKSPLLSRGLCLYPRRPSNPKFRNLSLRMNQCDIGLIGLAVMGENLVLNMESRGFHVAVYNRTTSVTEKFGEGRGKGKNFVIAKTLEEFVGALKRPRRAQIMVKAGAPVDAVIAQLVPLMEP